MAKSKRIFILLECTNCKSRNYTSKKNPENSKEKLLLKKFCKTCKKVTEHKEVKI